MTGCFQGGSLASPSQCWPSTSAVYLQWAPRAGVWSWARLPGWELPYTRHLSAVFTAAQSKFMQLGSIKADLEWIFRGWKKKSLFFYKGYIHFPRQQEKGSQTTGKEKKKKPTWQCKKKLLQNLSFYWWSLLRIIQIAYDTWAAWKLTWKMFSKLQTDTLDLSSN